MRRFACHKLLCALAILFALTGFKSLHAQTEEKLTLSFTKTSLEKIFRAIESQSSYRFVFTSEQMTVTKPVTISVKNEPANSVLRQIFQDQPVNYTLEDHYIIIHKIEDDKKSTAAEIRGIVKNENGDPLNGITIAIAGTKTGTSSDANGIFFLENVPPDATLEFSGVNVEKQRFAFRGQKTVNIVLKTKVNTIDEVQVIAYGSTTRKLNTGNVTTVTSKEIEQEPVSNPLAALEGRVPGMFVQSSSGLPGDNYNVQIRGLNSIAAGKNPLYVIDGVPYNSGSLDLLSTTIGTTSTVRGLSPLNSINPYDIDNITVLKDADATAIYGSRAANGVVLITTKKGRIGKTTLAANIYSGVEQVPHMVDMMDIHQYLQIRRESFANNGITPDNANAPDLLVWDTTKNTNWQKQLIGGTANVTDVQLSVSGGDSKNRILFGGSYHREGTVLPEDISDKRVTGYLNLEHNSFDSKFYANISVNYSIDKNNLVGDPTPYSNLPPNDPIYDSAGRLIFREPYSPEPYSYLLYKFNTQTNSLISNVNLRYTIIPGLNVLCNAGFTQTDLTQVQTFPIKAQDPAMNPSGFSYFGDNHLSTWIVEPQLEYKKNLKEGWIDILVGGTWQQSLTQGKVINAAGYVSDATLENIAQAGYLSILNNTYIQYNYSSVFGRINYNLKNKYILNASFRRDGSSRFGPGKQFGNFGAIGAAWIFSDEAAIKDGLTFLSFGKIRGSYGVTGNDQITDYQYLTSYRPTAYPYQIPGLRTARIANEDYSWETNKKFEISLDLGFLKNRILISTVFYQNRSGNQLVNYPLPGQSGFASYQANLPATVENKGWEFTFNTININGSNFKWTSSFNLTIPQNKLIAFPGLENTSYGTANLVIGQPLNLLWGYHYLGVDPATGDAQVADIDHSGTIDYPQDYIHFGTTLPEFYGGLSNTLTYKNLQLSFLFSFVKQISQTLRSGWYGGPPGSIYNQESTVWNNIWKQPGDHAILPKATGDFPYYYALSDAGAYEDGSYIKLKNLSLSYNFNTDWMKKMHLTNLRVFVLGQNLFTITHYKGFDPETPNATSLPNLRVMTLGAHFEF